MNPFPPSLLVAHVLVLLLQFSGTSASPPANPPANQPAAPAEAAMPKECTIGGVTFGGLHYLQGSYLKPGSIYAVCDAGVPKCYKDDGTLDKRNRPTVACPTTATPAAATRNLGIFETGARLWPQKTVCYRFANNFPALTNQADGWKRAMFLMVFVNYETKVGVKFLDIAQCQPGSNVCGGCTQAVTIKNDEDGCWAHVGYYPAPIALQLNVGDGCHHREIYIHELGHVLGLQHDHQHPQRQVLILRNLLQVDPHNYRVIREPTTATTAYDIKSIMHYDGQEMCLPRNPRGTLGMRYCDVHERFRITTPWCTVPTEEHCDRSRQGEIGGAKDLSPQDISNLKSMYQITP